MELLTRNNFESWMQKLMERLDRQDELLLAMKAEERQPALTESIRLFDNQDLCMLLQISKRTLQRYRSVGALPYKTLGKKTYYSEEDVLEFLSNHVKEFKKEDTGQENLLQRGGCADIPFQPYQGLQKRRYSLLQGSYP